MTTREDIIKMAREAGAIPIHKEPRELALVKVEIIKRFFHMAQAAEREACAVLCETYEVPNQVLGAHPDYLEGKRMAFHQAAAAIRARGTP